MINSDNLETNRLILREFVEADIKEVHEYASDPEVSKYVPWGPNTLKQTEEFVIILQVSEEWDLKQHKRY